MPASSQAATQRAPRSCRLLMALANASTLFRPGSAWSWHQSLQVLFGKVGVCRLTKATFHCCQECGAAELRARPPKTASSTAAPAPPAQVSPITFIITATPSPLPRLQPATQSSSSSWSSALYPPPPALRHHTNRQHHKQHRHDRHYFYHRQHAAVACTPPSPSSSSSSSSPSS